VSFDVLFKSKESASVRNNFATNSRTTLNGLQATKVISKRKEQHNILFK